MMKVLSFKLGGAQVVTCIDLVEEPLAGVEVGRQEREQLA